MALRYARDESLPNRSGSTPVTNGIIAFVLAFVSLNLLFVWGVYGGPSILGQFAFIWLIGGLPFSIVVAFFVGYVVHSASKGD